MLSDTKIDLYRKFRRKPVETVRSLAFDPLTRAQVRQVCEIGRRITRAIDLDTDVTYRAVRIGPGGLGREPVTSRHAQCRAACHVASQDRARGLFRALRPDPTGWLAPQRGRWLAAHQRLVPAPGCCLP